MFTAPKQLHWYWRKVKTEGVHVPADAINEVVKITAKRKFFMSLLHSTQGW
jgi:hypothetical protein